MTSPKIDHDFDGLARHLRGASKSMLKKVDLAMFRGALTLERAAKINAPEFQSVLTNSIHQRKVGELHYEVGTGQDYALAQEQGTKPGYWPDMTPSSDFYKWVKKITGTSGKEADRMAFLFGRSISRKGTKASEYMQRAYDDNIDAIVRRISRAVGKGLEA